MPKLSLIDSARPKGGDTEKITINLGPIDLGQIDLLVEEGFYSNRTDMIRTAIRNQLSVHAQVVTETVTRRAMVSAYNTSRDKTWKPRKPHTNNSTFTSSASPASPPMYRLNSPQQRLHRSWCSALFTRRPW